MKPDVFSPGFSKVLAVLVAAAGLVALVDLVIRGDWGVLARTLPPVALTVLLAWAVFWNPRVSLADDGVTIVNLARTVRIPWDRIEDVSARWSLVVRADGRDWTVWAAPRSSGTATWLRRRRGKDAPEGATAEAVEAAIEDWQRARAHADGDVTAQWHVPFLVVAAALAIATVIAVLA